MFNNDDFQISKNDARAIARRLKRQQYSDALELKAQGARALAIELEFANAETMSLARLYVGLERRSYRYDEYAGCWMYRRSH